MFHETKTLLKPQHYYPFGLMMSGRSWSEGYRFGFNGQEQDEEVYGKGILNTALYWEYDTRLGRRWNVDPKPNSSVSSYSCFLNNPMIYKDPKGDTTLVYHGQNGNMLAIIYDNLPNQIIILEAPDNDDLEYYASLNKDDIHMGYSARFHASFGSIMDGKDVFFINFKYPVSHFYNESNISGALRYYNKQIIRKYVESKNIEEEIQIQKKIVDKNFNRMQQINESTEPMHNDPEGGPLLSRYFQNKPVIKAMVEAQERLKYLEERLPIVNDRLHDLQDKKEMILKSNIND